MSFVASPADAASIAYERVFKVNAYVQLIVATANLDSEVKYRGVAAMKHQYPTDENDRQWNNDPQALAYPAAQLLIALSRTTQGT